MLKITSRPLHQNIVKLAPPALALKLKFGSIRQGSILILFLVRKFKHRLHMKYSVGDANTAIRKNLLLAKKKKEKTYYRRTMDRKCQSELGLLGARFFGIQNGVFKTSEQKSTCTYRFVPTRVFSTKYVILSTTRK